MTTDPHDFLVSVLARNEQQIQPFFDKWDKATFDDRHVFLTSNFAKTTAPGFDVELGWLVALGIHALQERELQRITKREE